MNKIVLAETKRAYIDSSDMEWNKAEKLRNLNFRASQPVDRAEAVKIMKEALCAQSVDTEAYNNFKPSLLKKLPLGSRVWLAREGSVCVYVDLEPDVTVDTEALRVKMEADECDIAENGQLRIWWD